jgi:hypothetical protein
VIGVRAPRTGVVVAAVLVALVAVPTTSPAQLAAEIPVVTTPAGEFQPARSDGVLAWERNTRARPNTYEVVVRPDGGEIVHVNRGTASAALGDILDGNVVYQQYRGNPRRRGRSSLYVFNISSGQRSRIPGVNSPQWEYWPSASGDWLLFARWNPGSNTRRLLLHNLDSGERRILDKLGGRRSFLGPGQVNGNYAVWYACRPRCEVFRYDITTRTRTAIGNPGAGQRAPSVTRGGTVYFSRGGRRCGRSVTLVRESLQGEQSVLLRLPDGLDIADTYVHEDPGGVTEVYYERNVCRRPAGSDIYKIREPSLATLTVSLTGTGQGTVTSSPAGISCQPDCTEDYQVGTTVTLEAHETPGSKFEGWSGACSEKGPCVVQMDSAKDVTAQFDLALGVPSPPRASITVGTEAEPSGATRFSFQTDPNISGGRFSLRDGESRTFGELVTGTYAVEELRLEDWDVEEIRCAGGGRNTEREQDGRTARIGLDPGEAVRCTFFNEED